MGTSTLSTSPSFSSFSGYGWYTRVSPGSGARTPCGGPRGACRCWKPSMERCHQRHLWPPPLPGGAVPGQTLATAIEMIFNAIFRHLECNPAQLKPIPRCAGRGWAGAGGRAGRRGGSRTLPFLCQQRVAAGDTLLTRGFPAALDTASQTRAAWVCQDAALGAVAPVTPSVLSIRGWGRAPTWVRFGALGLSLHLESLFPRVSSSEAPGSVTQHGAMCFEEATGRRVAVPLPGLLMAATSRGSQLSAHHGGAFVC